MTTNLSKQDRLSQIRVFVAVELPENLRACLGTLQFQVGTAAEAARWIVPDLLHITLRFLGEIPADRAASVEVATRAAAQQIDRFELHLAQMGAFPHSRNPRVLWAGLEPGTGLTSLRQLQAEVERRLAQHGFGAEPKPFSPHITIARLRERSSPEERRALGAAWTRLPSRQDDPSGSFPVESVTVMRSDLRSEGPRYTALARVPLVAKQARRGPVTAT
jgi:2'-5' RNA ligase